MPDPGLDEQMIAHSLLSKEARIYKPRSILYNNTLVLYLLSRVESLWQSVADRMILSLPL